MAPKNSEHGKKSWDWVRTTTPEDMRQDHVITAYRINCPACKSGCCSRRSGCRGNPNCIQNIGEKFWLNEISDGFWHDLPDPAVVKKEEGSYVGLQNLGATCYVNTFLQLWFHMPAFRAAVYSWQTDKTHPSPGIQETDLPSIESNSSFVTNEQLVDPLSDVVLVDEASSSSAAMPLPEFESGQFPGCCDVCGQLQLIFTQLHYSSRKFISPASFVSVLGLSKDEQQDAQEFCKLFLSLLESQLAVQPSCLSRNAVQELFGGRYSYVTTCSVCQTESSSPSEFLELDLNIQDKATLQDCIQDFLQEERLEGDDQYYCSQCMKKQNATRQIAIESLPPVLNMQLLRFVFDRATFRKKKLSSYLQFPEELDMGPFLSEQTGNCTVYDLTAVLTHHGPSAYSGHYIAYIYKKDSGRWWKFDDEAVTKLSGKKLQLAADETNYDGSKPRNKPKVSPGHQLSSKAYMLVYTRRVADSVQTDVNSLCEPPPYLQELVALDNSRIESWVNDGVEKIKELVAKGRAVQEEKRQLFESLTCGKDDNSWEWMGFDWLRSYFSRDSYEKPVASVDLSSVVCKHGRADPLKVEKVKRISSRAASQIYDKFGGHPRLNGDARLCMDCVRNECHRIRLMEKITTDHRLITAMLKTPCTSSSGYWVGKYSLRYWRKLLEDKLTREGILSPTEPLHEDSHAVEPEQHAVDNKCNTELVLDPVEAADLGSQASEITCSGQDEDEMIGKEIRTSDGNDGSQSSELTGKQTDKGKMVETGFNHELFCKEHGQFTPCESDRRLVPWDVWIRLKEYFPDAPEFPALHPVCKECMENDHAIAMEKDKLKELAVSHKSALSDLFYGRNRPELNSTAATAGSDVCQYMVSENFLDNWRRFVRYPFRTDCPSIIDNTDLICPHGGLLVDVAEESSLDENDRFCVVTEREWSVLTSLCPSQSNVVLLTYDASTQALVTIPACVAAERDLKSKLSRMFDNKSIYIRRIDNKTSSDAVVPDKVQACEEQSVDMELPLCCIDDDDNDNDAMEMQHVKKARFDGPVRRSNRRHVARGDQKITVSSHNTLRDLKLKIMNKFCVAPFDQTLSLNGCMLMGDNVTLEWLGVSPGDTIMLKEDEVTEDESAFNPAPAGPEPEQGFKGTGLVGV